MDLHTVYEAYLIFNLIIYIHGIVRIYSSASQNVVSDSLTLETPWGGMFNMQFPRPQSRPTRMCILDSVLTKIEESMFCNMGRKFYFFSIENHPFSGLGGN